MVDPDAVLVVVEAASKRTKTSEGLMSDDVLYERRGRAAWITLNAPENRNALSAADDRGRCCAHLRAAIADDAVRVIVLTGDGPAFCAGADLKGGGGAVARGGARARGVNPFVEILKTIWDGPKPVIAAVNGHAFGGGVGLVAAADIAIAVDSAMFSFSEVRIGVIPAMISVVVLPKLGIHQACGSSSPASASPPPPRVDYGLVHRVVPAAGPRRRRPGRDRRHRASAVRTPSRSQAARAHHPAPARWTTASPTRRRRSPSCSRPPRPPRA